MKVDLALEQMTVAEKLATMEALWADLARRTPEEAIPEWHAEVLQERERRLESSQEYVMDWEDAKAKLRREIDEGKDT